MGPADHAVPSHSQSARGQRADGEGAFSASVIVWHVFFPFAATYCLSYYFRTVNAVIAGRLVDEFHLDAAGLGLTTSVYFLVAAAATLPIGMALDHFGPKRVQIVSMLTAATGAVVFAAASDSMMLTAGRAMIGHGTSSSLLAGLKALVGCCPPARLALINGVFIAMGAAGAVLSSLPTEVLLRTIDWHTLFVGLGGLAVATATVIALVVPARVGISSSPAGASANGLLSVGLDPAFWRLAPLSALAIGAAWALQGLWCAPWLRDVARLPQELIAQTIFVMAFALCAGAALFGLIVHKLQRRGVEPVHTMAVAMLVFVLAELALALGWPVAPILPWSVIGAFGAGTVLSYTMTAQRFPNHVIGRANAALNLLHFGGAFTVQYAVGKIVALWPRDAAGHYAPEAYKAAFLTIASLQLLALLWFLVPMRRSSPVEIGAQAGAPPVARWSSLGWRTIPTVAACALLSVVAYYGLDGSAWSAVAITHQSEPHPAVTAQLQRSLALAEVKIAEDEKALELLALQLKAQTTKIALLEADVEMLNRELAGQRRAIDTSAPTAVPVMATDSASPAPLPAAHPAPRVPMATRAVTDVVDVCAAFKPPVAPAEILHFSRKQSFLGEQHQRTLADLSNRIKLCGDATISIVAFTDSRGQPKLNQRLSVERAKEVAAYLIRHGIARRQITLQGLGPVNPVDSNDTEDGRDKNRRVEISVQLR